MFGTNESTRETIIIRVNEKNIGNLRRLSAEESVQEEEKVDCSSWMSFYAVAFRQR